MNGKHQFLPLGQFFSLHLLVIYSSFYLHKNKSSLRCIHQDSFNNLRNCHSKSDVFRFPERQCLNFFNTWIDADGLNLSQGSSALYYVLLLGYSFTTKG